MGLILGMETITGEGIPLWFTESDSKILVHEFSDFALGYDGNLPPLFRYLQLELQPLKKIAFGDDESFESYRTHLPLEKRKQLWQESHLARELAWQDPKDIIFAINSLLEAMKHNPNLLQGAISERYYLDGSFRQDMIDLQKMAKWAQERGIKKVRMIIH